MAVKNNHLYMDFVLGFCWQIAKPLRTWSSLNPYGSICIGMSVGTHSGASSGGGRMTDVDAITEGISSSSDIGDCTRQEENDLKVGTTKQSLTPHENESSLNRESAGVIGEQSIASTESTGTLTETFNHQQPISPPASKIAIAPEEENLAKVGNPKTADSEDEKARTMSPEQGEISQSNHGADYSPDCPAPSYSTDAAVAPEDPNPSPRFQVEHKLTKAEHLQPVVTNNGEPLEDRIHGLQVHSTEDVGHSESSHGVQGDSGVDNSSECVPPSIPTVAVVVAPAKDPTSSRGAQVGKSLTDADHLQPASTNNGKPLEDQGETEDVRNNNSSQGVREDLRVDDSSESAQPFNPPVAAAVAPAKHSTSSRREKNFSNAVHLQLAGTYDNAKPLEYKGQTEDVGNNHSSHGAQGDSGVGDISESAPPFTPPVVAVVAPTKHSTLSRREKKPCSADHLQPAGTCSGKPLEYQGQPEDVGNNTSSHGARGVSRAENTFECVSPSNPTVAVGPAEHSNPSRREKKLTTAHPLQPASMDNGKPFEGQGQSEYFGHYNSLHDAQVDSGVDDSSECVAVAGAPAKHCSSKIRDQVEKKLSNADHLQPAGTNNAKAVEYQGQTVGVGHNDSLHGARGELGAVNTFEPLPEYYPTDLVPPAQHAKSSRQAQVEKKPTIADHLQPAGTNNAKPLEFLGQGLQAYSTTGVGHYKSSHDAQVDWGADEFSECAPPIFSVPHKYAHPSRGPQAEQKPTNAYRYQLARSNNGKPPEDQGQGLQQGHRRESVGHMTSSHSMQANFASISKSMRASPQNFQQYFAGATSGVHQINQAEPLRTSLLEHVQPQRPQLWTKVSKLGPYDGGRQLVPITQHQPQDPKPANKVSPLSEWHRRCIEVCGDNDELEREVESYKTHVRKMEQQIQDLTSKLKQAQETTALLNKQISKYEQQHAQELHRSGSYLDDSKAATPALLVSALNGVKDASNNFAKAFKAQVDSSPPTMQVSIKQHLSQQFGQVSRNGHIKFQYQAFVCQLLFEGFDHRNFGVFESNPGLPVTTEEHCFRQYQMHDFKKSDTVERLFRRDPEIDNFLHEYCFKKFSLIFNRHFEEQLFDGKCEHNDSIDKYEHPCNSRFYRSYCKLAVSIWLVHRLAFSFNQPAKLFLPPPGMPFNTSNMQSVVPLDPASDDEEVQLKVGFRVIPGMKVGESIVPSEVYVFGQ